MNTMKHWTVLAGLLSAGLALGNPKIKAAAQADAKPAAGQMQVEEPSFTPAIAPDKDAKASKAQRSRARGLTAEQKQAFRERKEKMQEMIGLITAKRRAIQAAKPEDRAALARELHSLILEKDPDNMALTDQARVSASDQSLNSSVPNVFPAGVANTDQQAAAKAKQGELLRQQQEKLQEKWQHKGNREND